MRKFVITIIFLALSLGAGSVWAEGHPWTDHAFPFDFLFGNNIDTHQQTMLMNDSELFGFLYITYTGKFNEEGIPIAKHCDEKTPPDACVVGWKLSGKPGKATFVFHEKDHPLWLVERRADIPQPGAFSHFHWVTSEEFPARNAKDLEQLGPITCSGYFLELRAVNRFVFLHAGEEIPVSPGIDIATHVNIVGSFPVQ